MDYEVPLKPSLLQAEQAQFPQPLLIALVLQSQASRWPSAELTQAYLYLSYTGGPRTEPGFQVWCNE